jgi:hypothetical protein
MTPFPPLCHRDTRGMVNRENPISGTKSTQGSNGAGNRFHDCSHLQQSKQSRALTREIPAYSTGSSLLTDGKKKSQEREVGSILLDIKDRLPA